MMKFAIVEGNYTNQRDEPVAIARCVLIEFPPQPKFA